MPPRRPAATLPSPASVAAAPAGNPNALAEARVQVRDLLSRSEAFAALSPEAQREIANNTVQVVSYLAAPEGIPGNTLPTGAAGGTPRLRAAAAATPTVRQRSASDPYALQLAEPVPETPEERAASDAAGRAAVDKIGQSQFKAGAAREGAKVAGALLKEVNFPTFVSSLVKGVFHAIVESSIEQMEAYGKLVADVAKTLNQFRDDNTTANQGRDQLVSQFPDLFEIGVDEWAEGGPKPGVMLKDGIDEKTALARVNSLPIEGGPATNLEPETIEGKLVPAARTQLATSRQQLLATLVLMGINRIVVTDGRISAKVLYDFQARDNRRFQRSAAFYDYSDKTGTTSEGEYDSSSEGGERNVSRSRSSEGDYESSVDERDASYYSKGTYKTTSAPVLRAMSAASETSDAALQTKASLAGTVDINFKSETFPLEKMADSFQIGMIQTAAKPGAPTAGSGAGTAAGGSGTGGGAAAPGAAPAK